MNRRKLMRYFDRKRERENQDIILKEGPAYVQVHEIIAEARYNKTINIPQALVSLKSLVNNAKDTKENNISLYAKQVLLIGSFFGVLKKYINTQEPKSWEKWQRDHITFVSIRSIQVWAKLSQEKGINDYTYLGISALSMIITAIDGLYPKTKFQNRLLAFFQESSYPWHDYKPTSEVKRLIEVHVFEVKTKREKITCNIESIRPIAEYQGVLNDKLIEHLLQVEADGGSADTSLNRLAIGKGNVQKLYLSNNNKSLQLSFDRTATMLNQISDFYLANNEKFGEIRFTDIEMLLEKLDVLYWDKLVFETVNNI